MRTAVILMAMLAAIPALAHSWYPLACCGNMDCFPVVCDQLVETVSGWLYVPTGDFSMLSKYSPVRITIAMCASGTAITARSVRSSSRTCSGAVVQNRGEVFKAQALHPGDQGRIIAAQGALSR